MGVVSVASPGDKHVGKVIRKQKGQLGVRVKAPRTGPRRGRVAIAVRRAPGRGSQARVALGRGGIRALKREGDGATPLGRFPVRQVLYRADRRPRPHTPLPVHVIRDDGWCDDPRDRNYNRMVKLPSRRSAESLKRADNLYDVVLVLGYNDRPRVRGKGSAIFVHLARPGYTPTDGCIALAKPNLLAVLSELRCGSEIWVGL
ncbi:MAG: L,D-transpeptidase family protein [Methyloceanibacter sp.]